jgi:hypothetical protein
MIPPMGVRDTPPSDLDPLIASWIRLRHDPAVRMIGQSKLRALADGAAIVRQELGTNASSTAGS